MVIKTDITHDGAFVAKEVASRQSFSRFGADGSYSTDQVERTTRTDDSQTCVSTSHFKRIDFDVRIDSIRWHCH
jgi:hypothetical protein